MYARDRVPIEQRVLLVAEPEETDALLETAPDLEIVVADPSELTRRAVDRRSRVAVWAGLDADAGLRAMKSLRAARAEARLLFVTPPEVETARLAALEAGVDEVVARPISVTELAGRIRLLLQRARPARRTRLVVGDDIELDL